MEGFREPYCFDRNKNWGGDLIYVRVDIPSKLLHHHSHQDGYFHRD